MLNKAILMGRLTRDPELRHTQSNTPVASFRLAVDRGYRSNAENPQQQTADFIDIVCWDKQAEFVSKWFTKGQLVAVAGRIQQREWKDKDGNNRTSFEIVANEVHFAEKRGASGADPSAAPVPVPRAAAPAPAVSDPASGGFAELEDDGELPF
ncbi:MAG: single-stranded DNA-binding protein [Oscillospiraceae bacterium]|jgi:single-strand DNA-binding protein|nr:single-stranded DNA-binding protein [Oscillospiraceae bacterium]